MLANVIGTAYEERPAQRRMAVCVLHAVLNKKWLVVEAGTGTGKTLAYMAPLLAMKRDNPELRAPIIVATATKALQDQIFYKDVPLVQRLLNSNFSAVVLKGRANYLCLYRLKTLQQRGIVLAQGEARWLRRLEEWSRTTVNGDREELVELPDTSSLWRHLSTQSDQCLGQKCPEVQGCFLTRARRLAQQADLIVVNHHLFFADSAIKDGGFGEILPNYSIVVFDEAHRIPDVATQFFGLEISNYRLAELARDIRQEFFLVGADDSRLLQTIDALEFSAADLRRLFPEEDSRSALDRSNFSGPVDHFMVKIKLLLEQLHILLEPHRPRSVGLANCGRRTEELLTDCRDLEEHLDDTAQAHWFETRGRGVFLRAAPIAIGPLLQEKLFKNLDSAIFTSATLTTGSGKNAFGYIAQQMGLTAERTVMEQLPLVFNYQKQALIYIPPISIMPEPDHPEFIQAAIAEIQLLLQASRGRALCLFTSMRMLNQTRIALTGKIPYPLLVQGDQPKQALLQTFRQETSSVLLGAASFWEGVDVPGESLSMVIIDRLPFQPPDDPLLAARYRYCKTEGKNPFFEIALPQAVLALKQGLGRLLRRYDDYGVIAILDIRLLTRRYGPRFFSGLPPAPVTRERESVRLFLQT